MRPSLLTWLCTSLSAGLPRWSWVPFPLFLGCLSLELFTLSLTQARPLEICNIHIHTKPGDCAAVCSRSASLHLATELLSCSRSGINRNLDLYRLGHLCFSWHVWSHCSFLRNLDLFLKTSSLRRVSRMSAFHLGQFSCRTRDGNSAASFRTEITRSLCN